MQNYFCPEANFSGQNLVFPKTGRILKEFGFNLLKLAQNRI